MRLHQRQAARSRFPARVVRLLALATACMLVACVTPSAGRGGRGARAGGAVGAAAGGRGRGGPVLNAGSSGIQDRQYQFPPTGESMEYAVYVSSKVKKGTKAPLVIALHGSGVGPTSIVQNVVSQAERGGYIVAAPMGYNDHAWFGELDGPNTPPPKIRAYAEQDVMNVLAMMRTEFDVDEHRIYLMGQSMGGAGALYIAVHHPDIWAAVSLGAPPIRREVHAETIAGIPKVRDIPFVLTHGDNDRMVTVDVSRRLDSLMTKMGMVHEYHEIRGGTHPDAILQGAPWIFAFFDHHQKSGGAPDR